MTGLRPALVGLGLLGVLLTVAAVAIQLNGEGLSRAEQIGSAIVVGGIMLSYIGSGLLAWSRRPRNLVGPLLCAVGFTYFLNVMTLSREPWAFTLGSVFGSIFFVAFAQLILTYPTGRPESAFDRRLLTAAYALAVLVPLGYALFSPDLEALDDPPANVVLLADVHWLAEAIDIVGSLAGVGVIIAILIGVVRRYRRATPAARRLLSPILICGGVLIAMLASLLLIEVVTDSQSTVGDVADLAALIPFMLLPFVFLAGLLRSRWGRATAVGDLVERIGGDAVPLRAALADALGDPTVELAYWLDTEERFVGEDGLPIELPAPGDRYRAAAEVRHGGALVGAVVHDASLDEERELVASTAAAAGLAMQNGRLAAELRARVADLEESRARIVTAGLSERRRIERDLHDGAQQRLVALSLQLGLARSASASDPVRTQALLDGAATELDQALEELRELARGIHPAILTDRGLGAAVEALAARSPTPVDVEEVPAERLPAAVEAAAYFVVSEALANLAKHAHAAHATVRVARTNGHAVVEIHDDGRGGADKDGHGLRGLSDRVAALHGHLDVDSPAGAGTTIRAEIPCASS